MRLPRTAQVLLIWAGATCLTFLLGRLGAADTPATTWGPAQPSWIQHVSFWDSGWYARIWREGYPSVLPTGDDGRVAQNAWAFMPGLPVLTGAMTHVLGWLGIGAPGASAATDASPDSVFYACACLISLAASAASAVLADRWLAPRVGLGASLWAVALAWSAPCALVMQVAYAESLALALLLGGLLLVERRRFLAAAPLLALACLTRPIGAPLTGALALWWVLTTPSLARVRERLAVRGQAPSVTARTYGPSGTRTPEVGRTDSEPSATPLTHPQVDTPTPAVVSGDAAASLIRAGDGGWQLYGRERIYLAGLTLWSALWTAAWPIAAWMVTGRPDAYTATETAWRGENLPTVLPALGRSASWVGAHLGIVLVAAVGVIGVAALSSRALRTLGPVAWCWCVVYSLYLALVFDPTSSLFRLLIPLVPMVWAGTGILARVGRRALVAALAAGVVGQTLWISWVWDLGSVTIHWVP